MFESVVIKRHTDKGDVDAGLLAETLLYYSSVHVIFSSGTLTSLLKTVGPDALLRLLEEGRMKGTFYHDMLVTMTNTVNNIQFHNFTDITIAKEANGRNIGPRDWVTRAIEATMGKGPETKRFTTRFLQQVPIRNYLEPGPYSICDAGREDIRDANYVQDAAEIVLRNAVPTYRLPRGWRFHAVPMQDGQFVVDTNLDFAAINSEYHKSVPPEVNSVTYAWVLNHIFDARGDIQIAADYMAELVTAPTTSAIVQRRVSDLLRRRDKSANQIEAFQNVALEDGTSVREAINSGERKFNDFLDVLHKADRFKEWLHSKNPDQNLVKEYQKEISS